MSTQLTIKSKACGNKRNTYTQNQKETNEISWIYNDKRRLGEVYTRQACVIGWRKGATAGLLKGKT